MNLPLMADLLRLNNKSYKTFSIVPRDNEESEAVSCPICFENKVRPHWQCEGFLFSRCVKCGHVYQNPRPKPSDLLDRYDDEYMEYEVENGENFFTLMRYGLRDAGVFSISNELLAPGEGKNAGSRPRALDIGCATGVLVSYLKHLGWDASGLEVCAPAAHYGMEKRGVQIHISTLEEARLPSNHFDLIHFSHVIEHLPDVNAFLAEVRRVARPGARVVITTPNRSSLQAMLMGSRWRSAIADHTHLFNSAEIRLLLKRHGFQPVRQKTWGGMPVGMSGKLLKSTVDRLARIVGIGDVVMVMGRTPA